MVSRAEHRRTTLLRLGDTAIELFGKHGPGVTIDEIAKQAGVSRRTVFRYVEAKEQLAFVHSMLWLDVLDDALEELAGETMSVRERLQLASHAIATHIDDNPDPPRNAFLLAIEHPELLKGFNIVFHQWIDRVAEEVMNLAPSPTVTTVFHSNDWEVFIEWSGRKALSPLSVKALRAREARIRERAGNFADFPADGCMSADDFGAVLLVLLALAILILLAPILLVALFAIVEVTIVVAIAGAVLMARTLLNRPWRVVAINPHGELWAWKQVGWQRARELVERIERELDAGADPARIAPGDSSPEGQHYLPDNTPTHLVESAGVRIAAKVTAIVIIAVAVVTLIQRLG